MTPVDSPSVLDSSCVSTGLPYMVYIMVQLFLFQISPVREYCLRAMTVSAVIQLPTIVTVWRTAGMASMKNVRYCPAVSA